MGIFPLLGRFAHSCTPSTTFHWSAVTHRMQVYAIAATPSSSILTITLGDPFAPASSRREALRRRFGFRCRCATCSLPEEKLRLSDARRARVQELWREMPFHQNAVDAVRAVDEALELLDEEGLGGFKGCFCYDAFQYCVACSVGPSPSMSAWAKADKAAGLLDCEGLDQEGARRVHQGARRGQVISLLLTVLRDCRIVR